MKMKRSCKSWIVFSLALLMFTGVIVTSAFSFPITYTFDQSINTGWSISETFIIEGNKLLGPFNDKSMNYKDRASLTIKNVPAGKSITVSFDLCLIGGWDSGGRLADRFTLSIKDGAVLMEMKEFPSAFQDKEEKIPVGNTGYATVGTREMPYWTINRKVTIPPDQFKNGSVTLVFRGYVSGKSTEFWGIDNVVVDAAT